MSVKTQHEDSAVFFVALPCFNWVPLFRITNSFDSVYKWFHYLREKLRIETVSYVIMPNHLHAIFYFSQEGKSINHVMGNGKRFLAYEIIKRLKEQQSELLDQLSRAVSDREKKKGQLHKVFNDSFDAKDIHNKKFLHQKIDYIHHNPVSGKWNLAEDFATYEHSSAAFYEDGKWKHFKPFDYRLI